VKHTPQRPFVPTPGSRPRIETAGNAAFKIAQPFVHGAKPARSTRPAPPPPLPLVYEPPADTPPREQPSAAEFAPSRAPTAPPEASALPGIGEFLHAEPAVESEPPGIDEYAYELPPVEHFMDPEMDSEVGESATLSVEIDQAPPLGVGSGPPGEVDTSEWSEADWQQFDWRSAAALGDAADPEATHAWSETDWDKAPRQQSPSGRETPQSAAQAIADALDGIARRIREGELSLPSPGSIKNPGDIAATLAALLGVKR